ncbi:MAG: N-acetylneuraminate synthase family protein [Candidatus Omnitrophica bacterium]|nr:N-acetylneuraminate synthase family protein [Candidatus Omnitrophota bacterium]
MKSKNPNKVEINIGERKIGIDYPPLVIAEIGINHEGSFAKAIKMIDDAARVGCECVKFQVHVIADEMIPNEVIPANAQESIWEIMNRCKLSEEEDRELKKYVEAKGMVYLSTPFSRDGADRLRRMKVSAFKIGSGECNNYPLVEHIASFGQPVILSTGMNNINSIRKSVKIFEKHKTPYALLHCTSMYPTPPDKIRLGALADLNKHFPKAVLGLSDHSMTNFPCLAAVALKASILERHFTSDKNWPGPDIPISMDPKELAELITGSRIIHQALGGNKEILKEEQPTIDFAYACVVSIKEIKRGERLTEENIWVKRPGTGEIKALNFKKLLGLKTKIGIKANSQIKWSDLIK